MKTIVIYYKGRPILLDKGFADLKGLRDGQVINEQAYINDIMLEHSLHQLATLDLLIDAGKEVKRN